MPGPAAATTLAFSGQRADGEQNSGFTGTRRDELLDRVSWRRRHPHDADLSFRPPVHDQGSLAATRRAAALAKGGQGLDQL